MVLRTTGGASHYSTGTNVEFLREKALEEVKEYIWNAEEIQHCENDAVRGDFQRTQAKIDVVVINIFLKSPTQLGLSYERLDQVGLGDFCAFHLWSAAFHRRKSRHEEISHVDPVSLVAGGIRCVDTESRMRRN